MRAAYTFRLALISAVAGLTAMAGAAPEVHAQAGARDRTLFVSAVDSRGEPVEDLGPDDFVITEDGRRREVLRVSRAAERMDIALLADNSGAASRAIPSIRDGMRKFVAAMAGDHQIALISLADRPRILVDYTSNRMQLEQGIGRLFAMDSSGMTLLDALVETSAGLRRRDATRAVIVAVITPGVEFTNRYARDVVDALEQAGAALHAVVIGMLDFTGLAERERAIALDTGPRATGGQHVTLMIESAVEPTLEKLARQLSSQYKVVYGRPESLIPPEKTDVTSRRPGVTMRGTPARGQTGA